MMNNLVLMELGLVALVKQNLYYFTHRTSI